MSTSVIWTNISPSLRRKETDQAAQNHLCIYLYTLPLIQLSNNLVTKATDSKPTHTYNSIKPYQKNMGPPPPGWMIHAATVRPAFQDSYSGSSVGSS